MFRLWNFCGALLGAGAVFLAAYHAHGLAKFLEQRLESQAVAATDRPAILEKKLHDFDTADRYQMYHAIALVLVGVITARRSTFCGHLAGMFFLAGVVLFSGLLYAQVFDHQPLHHLLIPAGGVALIAGWVALALGGCRRAAAME